MGRRSDPTAQYQVKPHNNNCYIYASTQPSYIDPKTGKKKYRYIHWGSVDENLKFIPGSKFYLATPEERAMLIFPDEWDMSEAEKLTGLRKPGRPSYDREDRNRFTAIYGSLSKSHSRRAYGKILKAFSTETSKS